MRKLIKELAKQATITRGGMQVVDIEKFAELIVRECSTQFYLHGSRPKARKSVLKYFGVEE